jgi:hypothetical protein
MGGAAGLWRMWFADACEASTTRPKPPAKYATKPNPAGKAHDHGRTRCLRRKAAHSGHGGRCKLSSRVTRETDMTYMTAAPQINRDAELHRRPHHPIRGYA